MLVVHWDAQSDGSTHGVVIVSTEIEAAVVVALLVVAVAAVRDIFFGWRNRQGERQTLAQCHEVLVLLYSPMIVCWGSCAKAAKQANEGSAMGKERSG